LIVADRFTDRVVAITGGGAGIGRTYARRFAAEGAKIVIADRDPDAGARVVGELSAAGADAVACTMDIATEAGAERLVATATEAFGGVDVLINNAAIHLQHARLPFTIESLDRWRAVMNTNIVGALNCTLHCRESMRARGGGAVLNQSSMAAYGSSGAYGVSKLALNGLTVALAGELASDHIRVNGVAPTLVDSEAAMEEWPEERHAPMIARQLIQRLGRMEDVADAALFLCSDEASFITGQTLLIDGGTTKKPY
jgi:3-oxoacyl-[acyl-carrier protein] reductase